MNKENIKHSVRKEKQIEYDTNTTASSRLVAYTIVQARNETGLTQKELSQKTGIAQGDISRLENGLANPSFSTITRIADALGMEVHLSFEKKTI